MKSCDCYVLLWSLWWIFDSCEMKSCDCCDSCKIVICVIMEFVMTGAVGRKKKKRKWEKKRKEKETWYLQSDLGLVGRYQAVPGTWPVLLTGGSGLVLMPILLLCRYWCALVPATMEFLAVAHFLVVTEESDPCPFQRRDLWMMKAWSFSII